MKKAICIIVISLAVVSLAVSFAVSSVNRASAERSAAERAASEEEAAIRVAKAAQLEKDAETERARAAEAKTKEAADLKVVKELEAENLELESRNLAEKSRIAADEKAIAEAKAKEAADIRAAKEAELRTAKENASAERDRAESAAAELQKAEENRIAKEAETLKLRVSLNELEMEKLQYAQMAEELRAYEQELREMERALKPEKTISDLVWLGYDENGVETNTLLKAKAVRPEDDPTLGRDTRSLARMERMVREDYASAEATNRAQIISRMEGMIRKATREDRIVDARLYHTVLKSLYPDWKMTDGEEEEK